MKPDDGYSKQDLYYLTNAQFTNGVAGSRYCCVKRKDDDGGMPKQFGIVHEDERTTIYLRDSKGELNGALQKYDSVEAMLDAGWVVD